MFFVIYCFRVVYLCDCGYSHTWKLVSVVHAEMAEWKGVEGLPFCKSILMFHDLVPASFVISVQHILV